MKTKQLVFKRRFFVSLCSIALVAFQSCSKDEVLPDDPGTPQFSNNDADDFNTAVANLSAFNQPEESAIEPASPEETDRVEDTEYSCAVRTYKGAPGYNELFMLDPTTNVIYPGALLKGESIPTGEYIRISGERAPITISTSFTNADGKPSVTIEDPSEISQVRDGITELLNREINGATAAELISDEYEVYSEEQLSIALGVNYGNRTKDISGNFDFSTTSIKRKYVLKFVQKYFTLDVDDPKLPSNLFTTLPSVESLGSTSPVLVESVTYGRLVFYTVESSYSLSEVEAAFSAAYDIGKNGGGVELEADDKKVFEEASVKVLIKGGSGSTAAEAVGGLKDNPSQIYDFIATGGNYSKESPGAPIAYKLSYVKQGFPTAKVVLSTEYQARSCDLTHPQFKITIKNLLVNQVPLAGTEGAHLEIWGSVEGELKKNGSRVGSRVRWVRASNNDLQIPYLNSHSIEESVLVEVERPDYDNDYIEIKGDLNDKDLFSSENIGERSLEIKLIDLKLGQPQTKQLIFDEVSFHRVVATFTIERMK